ncbi:uncharacterized protein LOC110705110 isoform X1 [Chenopodium quinoa]|uniref:F-box protein n=1 Tax=Chenopodium quinoa TaxID=63459 RepID=A0A803LP79_CHEQI|nr:uncharacterized protein LOC110705110 isoform X1 [Chenopodium quinoa]XP_021738637.1 uncharacterized protein LOC110705110 isoform X1 [Chenopodium quinoa]XP_021738638.1 uncharacterized protein LOC110705110 isoform X1 [Chenopodium quinoa]
MSDHAARPSHDEDATSMTSLQAHQPSWMTRWINNSSKPRSIADNSSFLRYNKGHADTRGSLVQSGLKTEDSLQSGKGISKSPEEIKTGGCVNKDLTKKLGNFKNKLSNLSFPSLTLGQYKESASTVGTEVDHEFGHKSMALTLAVGKEDTSRDFNLRNSKQQAMSNLFQEQKGKGVSRSFNNNKSDASKPVVVFERHFSNDNFTCFSQDRCKYQKSSSVLFHEKKMGNDLCHDSGMSDEVRLQHGCPSGKKNFQSFFLKLQSQNGGQPLDSIPCSFRNVETMRICTMVDSVENSPGDPPKISQRAHHILFTKETCVNMSKGHQVMVEPTSAHQEEKTFGGPFSMFTNVAPRSRGVNIQPLWTSTDDSEEKENTANPSICKTGSRNEASAETNGMQVEAPKNRHNLLGMEPSPSTKDDTMAESSPPAACDSSSEKTRSKRPITEIPDINEEAEEQPGLQPAVSSTDGKDPSTSRVRSLNAKQLFSSHEQTSESNTRQERSLGPDSGNRWIKRLKVSSSDSLGIGTKSSDMGEGSSHEKFNTFFNRITKYNRESFDAKLRKHHGKAQMEIEQNVKAPRNGGSSSLVATNRNRSMLGCSWIQRWCQKSTSPPPSNAEPLVICEPHRLKIGQDELAKKQFPSIAAMALMGKAMNGLQSCEFKKRGSIVVWNTKEY